MAKLKYIAAVLIACDVVRGANQGGQRPLHDDGSRSGHESSGNPFTVAFKHYAEGIIQDWKVPGVSIAVVDGDDVFAESFGYSVLPDKKAAPDTLWATGSTTKAFTAAALSLLIASQNHSELSGGWSTPVSSIIPADFVLHDQWLTNHITLEDAVSHRSGMPRHDQSWLHKVDGRDAQVGDVVRNMRNLKPNIEPRVTLQYCNFMYVTLSHVVETLTGTWLGDVLKENIWGPLGMHDTYLDVKQAEKASPERLSKGYYWHDKKQKYIETQHWTYPSVSGAGATISTVLDYAKWIKALIHGTGPFSKDVHDDIRRPRMIGTPELNFGTDEVLYGLGWQRTTLHGQVAYKHGGTTNTGGAQVMWLPGMKFGVVVFANVGGASGNVDHFLTYRLLENKLKIHPEDRYKVVEQVELSNQKGEYINSHAKDIFFPNRPSRSLPSSVNPSKIVGEYHEPGYGTLHITLEDTSRDGKRVKVLVATCTDRSLADRERGEEGGYELWFEHVSGDFWLLQQRSPYLDDVLGYYAGEIKVGVSGEVLGMKVRLSSPMDSINEGTIYYTKV